MRCIVAKTFILIAVIGLLTIPFGPQALAQEQVGQTEVTPDGGAMVVDLFLVRPFSFLTFVAGFTTFCLTAPVSAFAGNIGAAWSQMVVAPAKFTYTRPLGVY
jgi:hypothetical protein